MATAKVMVYDGDCPLCSGISATFVRLRLIGEVQRKPYQEYEGDLAQRMWEAEIRNEILVLDSDSGELRAGAPGILWMLRETWVGPAARLFELRPLIDLVSLSYSFIAYNRRFLSPPRPQGIACSCDPDDRPGYQWLLVALFGAFSLGVVTLLGAVAPPEVRLMGSRLGEVAPAVKAFGPWALPALLALTLARGTRLKYLAHLVSTAAGGSVLLLPAGLLGAAFPAASDPSFSTLLQLSCLAAGGLMFCMQRRRIAYLGLPPARLWIWTACAGLGLAALGWYH